MARAWHSGWRLGRRERFLEKRGEMVVVRPVRVRVCVCLEPSQPLGVTPGLRS